MGGTERVTIVLANEFVRRGYEVHIVSLVGNNKPFFQPLEQVRLHYVHKGNDNSIFPYRDVRRLFLLSRLFSKITPDLLIVVDASRALMRIPACLPYKTIYWEHFNTFVPQESRFMQRLSRRIVAKKGAMVVTLTQRDAEGYRLRYGAENVLCIPNPVSFEVPEYKFPQTHIVVAVGRYTAQKGFDLLIKAWARIEDKSDWKLHIVGKGKWKRKLQKMIDDSGLQESVMLMPASDNIVDLFANSGIYAMTSRFEGLPLVLIEAQACALPAVSFDCETGPSEIIIDGTTGILVKDGDIDAFASALNGLMMSEETRMEYSKASFRHIKETFSLQNVADSWERLFKKLS